MIYELMLGKTIEYGVKDEIINKNYHCIIKTIKADLGVSEYQLKISSIDNNEEILSLANNVVDNIIENKPQQIIFSKPGINKYGVANTFYNIIIELLKDENVIVKPNGELEF
jgi:hypothetical protein